MLLIRLVNSSVQNRLEALEFGFCVTSHELTKPAATEPQFSTRSTVRDRLRASLSGVALGIAQDRVTPHSEESEHIQKSSVKRPEHIRSKLRTYSFAKSRTHSFKTPTHSLRKKQFKRFNKLCTSYIKNLLNLKLSNVIQIGDRQIEAIQIPRCPCILTISFSSGQNFIMPANLVPQTSRCSHACKHKMAMRPIVSNLIFLKHNFYLYEKKMSSDYTLYLFRQYSKKVKKVKNVKKVEKGKKVRIQKFPKFPKILKILKIIKVCSLIRLQKRQPMVLNGLLGGMKNVSVSNNNNTSLSLAMKRKNVSFSNNTSLSLSTDNCIIGFPNLGNTCFINVILQLLFRSKHFTSSILGLHISDDTLLDSLYKLFESFFSKRTYDLSHFYDKFKTYPEMRSFSHGMHDIFEFFFSITISAVA